MQAAPVPDNEALRLAALDAYDLLDSPAEERFDRVTRIAAHLAGTPMALVSLVADGRLWFKSRVGVAVAQTERDWSFCAHTIMQPLPLVVADASKDPRFSDNPLVTGSRHLRFYAGVPLRLADGLMAGTLCVIDTRPRQLEDHVLSMLIDLARVLEGELQYGRLAMARPPERRLLENGLRAAWIDPITGCWNRAGFEALLQAEADHARRSDRSFALLVLHLHDLPAQVQGGSAQFYSLLLAEAASRLRRSLPESGTVIRLGDDVFAMVVSPCAPAKLPQVQRRVRATIRAHPFQINDQLFRLDASVGGAVVSQPEFDVAQALNEADQRMTWPRPSVS